jgi:hypothetical protein
MLNSSPVTGDRRDEAARRTVSFQDDVRRAPATSPTQPVGMAESDRNKSSWQKPAYTQSVHRRNRQNGIAPMRIIALLLAFVLAGCTGNRLNANTPMAPAFAIAATTHNAA